MTDAPNDLENRIASLQTLVFEMLAARDAALKLAAIEYERRLSLLNGEHNTLSQMRNEFVLRVVYDKDQDRALEESNAAKIASEQQKSTNEQVASANRRNMAGWWMAAGIAIVGWAITLILKFFPSFASKP